MDRTHVRAEIRALSLDERIELVQEVWDDIAIDTRQIVLTPSQEKELNARLARHQAAPHEAIPWEQVKADVLSNLSS